MTNNTIGKALVGISVLAVLVSCNDADVVSRNMSKAADQFEVNRRIVFYNGITGEYMLVLEGLCALGNNDPSKQLSVVCRTGPASYKKHFLGLSHNVTYFAEQIEASNPSPYHYRVTFKPLAIIPDIEIRK